jgi:hypothetical protein
MSSSTQSSRQASSPLSPGDSGIAHVTVSPSHSLEHVAASHAAHAHAAANEDAATDSRVLVNPLWAINIGMAVFFLAVTFIMASS